MTRPQYTSARDSIAAQEAGYKQHSVVIPGGLTQFKVDKAGMRRFDVLPYRIKVATSFAQPGMLHFERTYFVHRGVGINRESWNCPMSLGGKRCPICEERGRRQAAGEDLRDLSHLKPQRRQLWLVVDHDLPRPEPQIWDFSYYSFGRVLAENLSLKGSAGRDFYHFFHLDGGLTLHVGFAQKMMQGGDNRTPYYEAISIDFVERKRQYPEKLIDRLPCLDDMVVQTTYEELVDAYELGTGGADPEEAVTPAARESHPASISDLFDTSGDDVVEEGAGLFDAAIDSAEETQQLETAAEELSSEIDVLWGEPEEPKPKRGRKSQG